MATAARVKDQFIGLLEGVIGLMQSA